MEESRVIDVLEESEDDKQLKSYLSRINRVFGEDYATVVLSSDISLRKSLSLFSSKFDNIPSVHIQSLLLQNALLSNNEYYINFIKKLLNEDKYQDLFPSASINMQMRKDLIRLFVRQSERTNLKLYNAKDDSKKDETIDNIVKIKEFERFIRTREALQQKNPIKRKKGNRR